MSRYGGKCANEAVAISVLPVTYRFLLMLSLMFIRAQLTVCSIFLAFINFGFADYAASQSHENGDGRHMNIRYQHGFAIMLQHIYMRGCCREVLQLFSQFRIFRSIFADKKIIVFPSIF